MATTSNYPGGLDTIPNPLSSDPMNSSTVAHANLHTRLADALMAVQNTLGKNPQGGFATVLARLDNASYAGHTHTIANVTNLQSALDGKAPTAHTHKPADISSVTGTGTLADDLAARPSLATTTPVALASAAAVGTGTTAARADHVHPLPTLAALGAVATSTTVTPGVGLTGGGDLSANRTLSADFAGTGTSTQVARSDHDHDARYYTETEADNRFAAQNHNHDGVYAKIVSQQAATSGTDVLPSTTGLPTGTILAIYS